MQCFDGLVALGCASGRIEIWSHESLKCYYDDGSGIGIAKLKASGQYLLAARLNGCLESFHLEFNSNGSSTGKLCPFSLCSTFGIDYLKDLSKILLRFKILYVLNISSF